AAPEAQPRGDLWVAPDAELVPTRAPASGSESSGPAGISAATPARDAPVRDGQLRAPRRWERLLVEAAVIGGRDRWERRLNGLMNELRSKLVELGGEDEAQVAAIQRTLEELAVFTVYALPL